MPEATAAQTKLADTSKKYEDAYGKLIEEYKRPAEEFQNMKEDVLPAIRENKARDLADKQNKIQQFEQQAQEDLGKQQQELMAPIIAEGEERHRGRRCGGQVHGDFRSPLSSTSARVR